MKGKDDQKRKQKLYLLLYGMLWFILLIVVSAMAYQKNDNETANIFTAMEAVGHFKIFYWLYPVTWGACLKWSFVYWIGIALFTIYEQKFKHDAAGIEAGSAHWNNEVEEFNESHNEPFKEKTFSDEPNRPHGSTDDSWQQGLINYNNPDNIEAKPVPGNPNMIVSATVRLSIADMITHLNINMLVVGGAGTGKSRFFIKPNVLQMNCSFIVTDPSGELLKSMHNVLKENGYDIKVFNLVDMTHSCKYNPFKYLRSETDVSILVDCFISNTTAPDQRSGDPFWDKSEKALLSSLIFYLVDIAGPEFQTFSTVLWMVQLAQMDENQRPQAKKDATPFGFTVDTPLDELFSGMLRLVKKRVKNKDGLDQEVLDTVAVPESEQAALREKIETSLCLTNYKTFKLGGAKTLKSILISAAVRLNPFSIPTIKNLTSEDQVELGEVGDRLTCFFAIIPQTNNTFNFLVSMLFSQMFETLYYKGSTIPNSRLNYHVRFLLDEFANIGKIPEFPQKISTCRKYNISTTIVLQSIAQIKMLYKDDYETIIGNCDTAICLGTNEQTTADYFSKKLGKTTITSKSKSTQVGKAGGSMSFNQTGRELMMPDEIMTMPFDECIVMMNHIDPFYDKKYPLEKHPQYKYTGDANKDNLYSLEEDDEFLCVDHALDYAATLVREEFDQDSDQYAPKTLEEVLGELLINNPNEDGYFLVKDASPKKSKLFDSTVRDHVWEAVEQCVDDEYQIAFYDGEYIDPYVVEPMLNMVMNDKMAPTGFVLAYIPLSGNESERNVKAAAKTEFKNVENLFENLHISYETQEGERLKHYKVTDIVNAERLERIRNGCKNTTTAAAEAETEEKMNEYMDF